jgi:hypothetical protein
MASPTRFLVLAMVLAVTGALFLALGPSVHSASTSVSSDGTVVNDTSDLSLLESEGPTVLLPLAVPVLLAGVALACRDRTVSLTTAGLCLAGCLVAAASIGLFFLPAALLLLAAGLADRNRPQGVLGSTT